MRRGRGCGKVKRNAVGFLCDGCLGGSSRGCRPPPAGFSDLEPMRADWCDDCGARHSPERRRQLIARMLPAKSREIVEEWAHLYPNYAKGGASEQMLFRDLRAVGAVSTSAGWTLPARCLDCGHRHGGRAYGLCLAEGCDCVVAKRAAEQAA